MGTRWEYCLVNCTRMPGRGDAEHLVVCQLVRAESMQEIEFREGERSPLTAIAQALNRLGRDGWELVSYDTSTNRGVLKRPRPELGGQT